MHHIMIIIAINTLKSLEVIHTKLTIIRSNQKQKQKLFARNKVKLLEHRYKI